MQRAKTLEQNQAQMHEVLKQRAIAQGLPLEDFNKLAHSYVYGGANKPNENKSQMAHKDPEADPAYEPDDEDLANAEEELARDE